MKFSHSIIGSAAFAKALGNIEKSYKSQYVENLKVATLAVHSQAVKSIREKSSGDSEVRYGPKRTVTASKPGEAPNTDTGTAIKSVGFNIDEREMIGEIGTGLKYLKHLEHGTKHIAARPWLFPALESVKKRLVEIFKTTPKHKGVG